MLSPLTKTIAYYGHGGFAAALLCATFYFDLPGTPDGASLVRVLRRAKLLAAIGLIHPVIALTAYGIARDASRSEESSDPAHAQRTKALAGASLVASSAVAVGAFVVAS